MVVADVLKGIGNGSNEIFLFDDGLRRHSRIPVWLVRGVVADSGASGLPSSVRRRSFGVCCVIMRSL
jgi:hypothetical protein